MTVVAARFAGAFSVYPHMLASFWSVSTLGCWIIVLFPFAAVGCTIVHWLAVMSPRSVHPAVHVSALVLTLGFAFVAALTIHEAIASPGPVRGNSIILALTLPPTVLGVMSVYRVLKR